MSKNIITISRQFGSGGRTVGRMLAERLGVPFYDKELVKQVKKFGEEAKVTVRNVRRDTLDKLKTLKKNNEITEDDMKDIEKDVQKVTDTFCDKVDAVISAKEKEIMSI